MIVYTQGQSVQVIDEYVPPVVTETAAVNPGVRYQTMDGWEATAIGWAANKATLAYDPTFVQQAPAMMARLVNELGIDRLQLPVRSGWMNTVDYWPQFVSGQINYLTLGGKWYQSLSNGTPQFAEFDFNVQHMLDPFLALTAGKPRVVSLIFTDFGGAAGKTLDFSTNPAAYAAFVKVYVDRLAAHGVTVDWIDVVLEPENSAGWQNASRIGSAMVALKALLPNVRLVAPSCTNAYNTVPFCQAIENVPGALAAMDTVGYHRYGSGDYVAIAAWAQARGKKTGMTEWFNATIDTILDDLLLGQVSTWQKWSIGGKVGVGSNPQSSYYIFDGSNINFATNTHHMALLFPYVRLGAQRIGLTAPTMSKSVAFENANGKQTVLLKRSVGAGTQVVGFTGMRPGVYGVRQIVAGSTTAANLPDITIAANGTCVLTLVPGYTTVYAR